MLIKSPTFNTFGSCSDKYGSCPLSGTNDFHPSLVKNGCSGVNSIPGTFIVSPSLSRTFSVYKDGKSPNDLQASS